MKAFFIYLLTSIQFLSSSHAIAQYANLTAPPVTFTLRSSYPGSYPNHISPLHVNYSWARSKHSQMAHVQGAHLPFNPSLLVGKIRYFTDTTLQSFPYRIHFKKDGPLTGVGIGLYGASALLKAKEQPLSTEKVSGLAKNQIWVFDRGATR